MSLKYVCIVVLLLVSLCKPAAAQEQKAALSLTAETTMLQTGQEYVVTIQLANAPGVWSMNLEMAYDAKQLYIMGTKSGSPVRQGAFFSPPEATIVVRNEIYQNRIIYTISKLGETESAKGSGVIGTFRIYPLAPGKTTLTFFDAKVTDITHETNAAGEVLTKTLYLPFTPVMLELEITGDPVEPPSEATATPPPTETPLPFAGVDIPTEQPGLVNVTAAPVTATPIPSAPPADSSSAIVVIGIGALMVIAVALVVLFIVWRRTKRK